MECVGVGAFQQAELELPEKNAAFPQQLHGDWEKCEVICGVNAISSLPACLKAACP